MVSTKTLMKVAVYGGIATISAGLLANWEIQARLQKSEYFREAMKILRVHPGAVSLLGEPIKMGQLDLGDTTKNFCDGYKAQFKVPVKGPQSKGTMYFWAERENTNMEWDVYKVHLDIEGVKDKRLIIKDATKSE
ncbi:uncharacterized protein LOC126260618 [Schistocerca nitens]|uniref:uncharacterized protein LOC126260618 n=1 Tax=Schistocerca nitens TaxID=7011 RepID=UPI002118A7BA|nr:uncharacterized protein LOC126260618 [Schistocerca nitens]